METTSIVAALNAQTVAANLADHQNHLSKLWTQATQRFPELRNATQYYAYDVAKMSKMAMEVAMSRVTSALSSGVSAGASGTSFDTPPSPVEGDPVESEVHYLPAPSRGAAGLAVKSAELQTIPGPRGGMFLTIILAKVGHAIFEVCEQGVHEVIADIGPRTEDVVAIQVVSREKGIVVLRNGAPASLERVLFGEATPLCRVELPSVTSPEGLRCIGTTHVVLTNRDFYQLHTFDVDTLTAGSLLYADANLQVATSRHLIAFNALREESGTAQTRFVAKSSETAVQSVARSVSTLSKMLWGSTPQAAAQPTPLGTVALFDVSANGMVGSFSPHNHVVVAMKFSHDGTLLATASKAGTTINVFQVFRTSGSGDAASAVATTSVTLLARLSRGMTRADVEDIAFSPLGSFVAVVTALGTCHLFHLRDALVGWGAVSVHDDSFTAAQLSAIARVRSAPYSGSIIPRVAFSTRMSDDTQSCLLCLSTSQGVVTGVKCTPRGLSSLFGCYLDSFKGPLERPSDTEWHSRLPDGGSLEDWVQYCNAQVELDTHDSCNPLENFCCEDNVDGAVETIPGDWDECVELQRRGDDEEDDDDDAGEGVHSDAERFARR